MTKKILKNILLTFVIVYTITNILGFIITGIERRNTIKEVLNETKAENMTMELYEESEKYAKEQIKNTEEMFKNEENNVPIPATQLTMFRMYIMGVNYILEIQLFIIICSICFSIVVGIIISLTEKSKVKEILFFILIGLTINLIYTICFHLTRNLPNTNFFEGFTENFIGNIDEYGMYYILAYIVAFITRYLINKNKASKLNKELKSKQNYS